MADSRGSNWSFFLGAGALLVGVLVEKSAKAITVDNIRSVALLVEEIRDRWSGEPTKKVITTEESEEESSLYPTNYDPFFDREMPPPPPPSFDNFKTPGPVAISRDEDDFLSKINDEVLRGGTLIQDWAEA